MVVCTRVSTHTAPIPSIHINLLSDKVNLRFAFSMPPKARKSRTRSKRKESTCRTPRGSDPKNLRSQKVTPQRQKKDKCCCCNGPDREDSLGEGDFYCGKPLASQHSSINDGFFNAGKKWLVPPLDKMLKHLWSHCSPEEYAKQVGAIQYGNGSRYKIARHHIHDQFYYGSNTGKPADGQPNLDQFTSHLSSRNMKESNAHHWSSEAFTPAATLR